MTDIASLIAAHGIDLDLQEGDLIAGVVLVTKVLSLDGEVSVAIGISEGMSWLEQLGLLTAADDICRDSGYQRRDEGESD